MEQGGTRFEIAVRVTAGPARFCYLEGSGRELPRTCAN